MAVKQRFYGSLKTLGSSQKTLRPPGIPSWLRAWFCDNESAFEGLPCARRVSFVNDATGVFLTNQKLSAGLNSEFYWVLKERNTHNLKFLRNLIPGLYRTKQIIWSHNKWTSISNNHKDNQGIINENRITVIKASFGAKPRNKLNAFVIICETKTKNNHPRWTRSLCTRVNETPHLAHRWQVVEHAEQLGAYAQVREALVRQQRKPVGDGRYHAHVNERFFEVLRANTRRGSAHWIARVAEQPIHERNDLSWLCNEKKITRYERNRLEMSQT